MPSRDEATNRDERDQDGHVDREMLLTTARELVSIATQLGRLQDMAENAKSAMGRDHDLPDAALAEIIYRDRRLRNTIFDSSDLFGEPAWDALLDLYISHKEGRQVSVTSACIAASVPTTTGLRCIKKLEEGGYVRRTADIRDGRRALLSLTEKALAMIELYLAESGIGRLHAGHFGAPGPIS